MDNYRPISVLNNISKVIERLAYNQMYEHLEINNLITPHQSGFQRNRSTQQCIVNLTNTIRMNVGQGECTTALYMDLRKAFDTANHTCIIKALPDFGLLNTELEWLIDYLFHRKQQVKIEVYVSDAQSITGGVPQGSILGPLLFLLLINNLPSTVKSCQIILYADDAVLYYAHKTPEVLEQELNADANRVANWLMKSGLSLNLKPEKTELVKYVTTPKVKSALCKIDKRD